MLATECEVEVSYEDVNQYALIYSSFPAAVNARVRGLSFCRIITADVLASIVGSSGRDGDPQ